ARAAAVARHRHDLWLLVVGLALGLLLGAYVWRAVPAPGRPKIGLRSIYGERTHAMLGLLTIEFGDAAVCPVVQPLGQRNPLDPRAGGALLSSTRRVRASPPASAQRYGVSLLDAHSS